jgi:hypothetical protein
LQGFRRDNTAGGVPVSAEERRAPDPDDALHDPACGRSPGHRDPLCPKCASDYRIAEIVNRNKPNAKRKPPRSVPAPEPSARLLEAADAVDAAWTANADTTWSYDPDVFELRLTELRAALAATPQDPEA